ncbi:hypothetical protein SAMN05216282_13019 [Cryobacterium psychrotolerans]|uniref:Uncharacterized protein n=1 Tax=Cryobacterium psychrotolerans TaxID=386301 RepID=A0A1G9HG49_9MICO|nr:MULTISPECIES: hypothetical protein [Cryobacterium]TFD42570.1 hypothetical protein E3T33_11985 [Cryobacterium sp. TMT1-2-1]TFD83250.1 hypothetical protein E3T56_13405 [Cryobacterium psychrotolerans]SDL11473.1 hypothetical protein SAMN05216282_13019 [Cryobacterium psychrotolerans]
MTHVNAPITVELKSYGQTFRHTIDPNDFVAPALMAQLAIAWKEISREVPSATNELCQAVRGFGRHLGEQPFDLGTLSSFRLGALRVRHLNAWEMDLFARQSVEQTDTRYRHAVYLFSLLRRIEDDNPGTLDAAVADRVRRQTRLSHIRREGDPDHSDNEVRRIRSAAHRLVHQALHDRITDPDYLPRPDVMVALHVLLSLATGEPPEVIRSITIDHIIGTPIDGHRARKPRKNGGELARLVEIQAVQSYAVTLTKNRSGLRYEEIYDRNLDRAAHRTLTAILTLTAHARTLTAERSLWIVAAGSGVKQLPWNSASGNLGKWYGEHVLGSAVLRPHKYARLRKVVLRREQIANPTRYLRDGRRHTTRTLFDHYTNSAVLRAEAGKLVVEAISDYFNAAVGPTVITPDAEAMIRAGHPVEILDPGTALSLFGGELDGALAACRNPVDSPYAPPGHTCPSSQSGQCFTCPNAIITQEHLPALILLDEISDPENAADATIWRQVWEPIHRSTRRILPMFPASAVRDAASRTGAVPVELGIRNDQRGIDE